MEKDEREQWEKGQVEKGQSGRKPPAGNPSEDFIEKICNLYGDVYDDREEDSRPGGEDWVPGMKALHTSLSAFQRELEESYGIRLSTAKLRKILITGGRWTTERSREVTELYGKYGSIRQVAEKLGVTDALVTMYLPYEKVVYDLEEKSRNAQRIDKCREKKGLKKEGLQKEGLQKEGLQKEDLEKEGAKKEGLQRGRLKKRKA